MAVAGLSRARQAVPRLGPRWVVALAALAAFALRLPGIDEPPGPDESGFLLVARSWDPQPGSLYGRYFVDRPPLLIAVFRLVDNLGGIEAIRLLGALACAVLVVVAALTARLVAGDRAIGWTAMCTAAITANPMIDPVDVKGELLGLPFVMAGCWLALAALRRESAWVATLAGLSASLAVGFKQSLLGGLVFASVLLVASWATGRIDVRTFARLVAGGLLGAAAHPVATVAWALAAGVDLDTLWYAVWEFRADASAVLAARQSKAASSRAVALVLVAVLSGVVLVFACFVALLPAQWRQHPALVAAISAGYAYDGAAIVISGSFWRDYLFALVPVTAIAAASVIGCLERGALVMPTVVTGVVLSCGFSVVAWLTVAPGWLGTGGGPSETGRSVAAASRPGDTLTVFGGSAHIQLASGLPSPYHHLWSLPMRTMDPELEQLAAVLSGPRRPTWLVQATRFETWQPEAGARLRGVVEEHYERVLRVCGDRQIVWRARGVDRPDPEPRC